MPCAERSIAGGTMVFDGETMVTELKVVVDPAVGGQKPLRVTSGFERLHLLFSSPCRLLRHLGTVVEIAALSVLDTRQDCRFAAA
jgi:hypothetical protein